MLQQLLKFHQKTPHQSYHQMKPKSMVTNSFLISIHRLLGNTGVCLYISNRLKVILIQFNSLTTDVWLQIHNQTISIVVSIVYRGSSDPCVLDSESNLAAMLSHMMSNFASYDFVLLGDFNLLEIQWIDGYAFCNTGSFFLSALSDNSLCQTNS